MSSRGRWALVLVSILAVSALGTWGCCSVRWCDKDPAPRIVIVKQKDAERTTPYLRTVIYKHKHQQIVWQLSAHSPYTSVVIPLGTNDPPFVACETHDGACYIACENKLCLSGSINPALNPSPHIDYDGYYFKGPAVTSSDPGIRIDP